MTTSSPDETLPEFILIGGSVDRTSASLRFFHDELDPSLVTEMLQCEPTHAQRKGDLLPSKRRQRVARTGSWCLHSPRQDALTLEQRIAWLLDHVSDDLSVWERLLKMSHRADIFCGLFLQAWNRGLSLSPLLMNRLAERGLRLEFDIYCNSEAEAGPHQP